MPNWFHRLGLWVLAVGVAACAGPLTTLPTPVASPVPPTPTPLSSVNAGQPISQSGLYAFPVDAPLENLTWTHFHWDGSNAVDIEAAPSLTPLQFSEFMQVQVLAPASGLARVADSPLGGLAYQIFGDDGRVYFLGHLSVQFVPDNTRVPAGQPLGRIGNTGRWTQYIEPHLHFVIGTRDLMNHPGDINAAEWLRDEFGLQWRDWPSTAGLPSATPSHWPVDNPQILTSFAQLQASTPELAGLSLLAGGTAVYAPLTGQVNVHRSTVVGNRVQVHNPQSGWTVVVSGLESMAVQDGDLVTAGQVVGELAAGRPLHLAIFAPTGLIDPTTILPPLP